MAEDNIKIDNYQYRLVLLRNVDLYDAATKRHEILKDQETIAKTYLTINKLSPTELCQAIDIMCAEMKKYILAE